MGLEDMRWGQSLQQGSVCPFLRAPGRAQGPGAALVSPSLWSFRSNGKTHKATAEPGARKERFKEGKSDVVHRASECLKEFIFLEHREKKNLI